ncbi:MAG: hypothetical protein JSR77_06405 [Planctomycetes bacterium]|nr:hypothetical protein [Planctomycetota bacterium]
MVCAKTTTWNRIRVLALCLWAGHGAAAIAQENPWALLDAMPKAVEASEAWIRPLIGRPLQLDTDSLRRELSAAPMESFPVDTNSGLIFSMPHPDGGFTRFRLVESPIMAPELAAKFPEIKTYAAQGIDDPAALLRCDLTPQGFHAMVLAPGGDYFIDPFSRSDHTHYTVYYKRNYLPKTPHNFACGVTGQIEHVETYGARNSGTQLRTYDLAVAATGEYTAFHGGTVALAQAAVVTAVNRVTGLYERDVCIRLRLIANNSVLMYTNSTTDPYTNSDGVAMLAQNQSTIDSVIGSANYDVGHVFSTGGGGVAGLGVVCSSGNKARGVTGSPSPTGDAFWIDYVAHEMGHQFGGNHSYNGTGGNCGPQRAGSAAYEPGSGSTIMSYAGICSADDLQPHSDAMFNTGSYDEIRAYTNAGGAACSTTSATGNTVPTVNAGADYNIPKGTPFTVTTTSATDANGDALTFDWEERDLGASQTLASPDNGTSPIFRVWSPTSSNSRTFPRYSNVLSNTLPIGEKSPAVARTLRLRCMVRDNRLNGGGVIEDNVNININGTAGPFLVTSPNTAVSWTGGSQTVTWDVAGTTAAPISCANVRILLSTDGGQTWPTVLADSTPNDGSEAVTIPSVNSTQARIRVEAVNNIFFDISNVNFTLTGAPPPPAPTNVSANPTPLCRGSSTTLSGTVGANQTIDWYTGTCGGALVGSGTSLIIVPTITNTYYARARDLTSGVRSTTCASVVVTVNPLPVAPTTAGASRTGFCASDGGTIQLSSFGGSGTTLRWYSDTCGGTLVGTGASIVIDSPAQTTTYFARWETASCGSSACASVTVAVLPIIGDFNLDGGIDGSDVEAFYSAWEAAEPTADVNQDGGVDGSDIQTFFLAWQAGNC